MTKREFARLLARGHGRAVTFLQQTSDPAPFLPAVRRACERPKVGWWGSESPCGPYLLDVLHAAGMADEETPRLREKLKTSHGGVQSHLFELVGAMARMGDENARQAMRDAFTRNVARKKTTGAGEIIETEGFDGFLFVVGQVAAWLSPTDDGDEDALSLVYSLEGQLSEEATDAALAHTAEEHPALAEWLTQLRARRASIIARRGKGHRPQPTEEDIRQVLDSDDRWTFLRSMGRRADDATALRFARELLTEPDPARQTRLLHLFRMREKPFPLDHRIILEMAHSDNEERARAARDVLEKIMHPDVRAFALKNDGLKSYQRAELLVLNPGEGDWPRLAAWLARRLPAYEAHAFGMAVFGCFKRQPAPDAAETLVRVYNTNPCAYCRMRAVEHLLSLNALPDTLRDECRWDAEPETRRLVS